MKLTRRRGSFQLHLDRAEVDLLGQLLDDLDDALGLLSPADPVRRRLFPDGYRDDADAAAEFRELTETGLVEARSERIGLCRAQLPEGGGQIPLDDESLDRWLTVLNDLRLALGTRLGITEDDEPAVDPADPAAATRYVYHWLTELQVWLVDAAMG